LVLGLLGLRRRRAAVAAAVSVAACGPTVDDGGVGTSGADTTSAEASTVATGVGSETTASTPTLVPEDWIGTYHSVGSGYGEVRYTPIPTAFLQFEIRGDGTCALENWHCAQTDPMAAVVDVFGCWFEDGFVRVQPSPGSYYEEYQYVDFYLGPECGMLHEVTVPDVDDYPPLPDGPSTAVWFRGRLCIVQNCDPVVAQDPEDQSPWIYDFCPGEPRDCPCPETGTSCE
jgi:hypothetical protein